MADMFFKNIKDQNRHPSPQFLSCVNMKMIFLWQKLFGEATDESVTSTINSKQARQPKQHQFHVNSNDEPVIFIFIQQKSLSITS